MPGQRGYCRCGVPSPPGSRFCPRCGGYASPDDGPLGKPIQWRIPQMGFCGWWLMGLVGLIAFIAIGSLIPRDPAEVERESKAHQIFTRKIAAVSDAVPGSPPVILRGFEPDPHVVMEGDWYGVSHRQKELFLEGLGGVWISAQAEAGISEPAGSVIVEDTSGHEVGYWSHSLGTHVERE